MSALVRAIKARPRLASHLLIAALFVTAVVGVYYAFPKNTNCSGQQGPLYIGIDWMCIFRPAVVRLFHFQTPYTGEYFNPFWTPILLSPLALLPPEWGAAVMAVLVPCMFTVAAVRLSMKPWTLLFFMLNPFVWTVARQTNLEWMVAFGVTLPPQIGLFFVLSKHQAGVGIALFWLVEALRQGGIRQAVRTFAPIGVAYIISVALFGLWFVPPAWLINFGMNYSLWPLGLPIGIVLLVAAIKGRDIHRAISASPFFSPYVLIMTWSVAYFGLQGWEMAAATLSTWVVLALVPTLGQYPIHLLP